MTSAWGHLGAMERTSVLLKQLDRRPSALSTPTSQVLVASYDEPAMSRHLHQ